MICYRNFIILSLSIDNSPIYENQEFLIVDCNILKNIMEKGMTTKPRPSHEGSAVKPSLAHSCSYTKFSITLKKCWLHKMVVKTWSVLLRSFRLLSHEPMLMKRLAYDEWWKVDHKRTGGQKNSKKNFCCGYKFMFMTNHKLKAFYHVLT